MVNICDFLANMAERDQSCRLAPSGDCKKNIVARMGGLRFCFTGLAPLLCVRFALAGLFLYVIFVLHVSLVQLIFGNCVLFCFLILPSSHDLKNLCWQLK